MALPVKKKIIPTTNRNHSETLLNSTGDLYIMVHETANTDVGADAEMHARFVANGGGSSSVSFHFAVDHTEAWQMLECKWAGWHASDGCDDRNTDWGCFRSVAIETTVDSGNINKTMTRRNLAVLIAMIIDGDPAIDFGGIDHKRFSADRIRTHNQSAYDRKWCPRFMLDEGYIPVLVNDVKNRVGVTPVPGTGIVVGDYVRFMDNLNIRTEPSLKDIAWNGKKNVITTLPMGTEAKVIGGPAVNDGYGWWNVEIAGFGTGFIASNWLEEIAPPAPPKVYATPVVIPELAALRKEDKDTAARLVLKNGIKFRIVWDEVEAIRETKVLQFAYDTAKEVERPAQPGERKWVPVIFEAQDGKDWYYGEKAERLIADDWKRVQD